MNFEYLVQRYIDGEITPTEDLQLQNLMRGNLYLRSQFEQIVSIQHAYTEQKKPLLNEKDSESILDILKIAMVATMASTAHAPITTTSVVFGITNLFLPLLLTIFFVLSPNNATSPLLKQVSFKTISAFASNSGENVKTNVGSSRTSIGKSFKAANAPFDESLPVLTSSLSDFQSDVVVGSTSENHQIQKEQNLISTELAHQPNDNLILTIVGKLPELKKTKSLSLDALLPLISFNIPVKVELSVLSSFNGMNNLGSIRSAPILSQFVAVNYGINSKDRFGIEFGSTSFVGFANGVITKPLNPSGSNSSGVQSVTTYGDSETPEVPNDDSKIKPVLRQKYDCEDIEYRKNIQIFQSSVFYEREIVGNSLFSLNSRVGIGVTNIGVTTYSKTLIELKASDNFTFTTGAEYRFLTGNAGSALQSNDFGSSMLTIQTGITIKF